ncbi:MAG: UvrD-helicase domain-containing protein [Ignavibacteriales bacterium]|nr:UvrD-helicase domain-containing protein [Ignavibacteriales bacterium]
MMKFLNDLNPVQAEAVKAANGPVMIIAGAGSGKTRVLTYRIAYLMACGVPAHQILALTFTNKAAKEMKNRIMKLVGDDAGNLWMGTFHSMFARILRKECMHLKFTPSFTIYDSDDSLSTIKKVMEKLNLPTQQFNPLAIRSRISNAKNQYLSPRKFADTVHELFDEKAALVYLEYQKTLERSNAMDFDDLLVKPIELFEKKKEVLEKYQYRFKFILVDEFQDTNRAQYQVIRLLGNMLKNIAVVGDDAQSIYSFRGADIRNILDFQKDYPGCQLFRLEQNYRSTKSIISVADELIHCNKERLKKKLWTSNPAGEPVTIVQCADDHDEGSQIVRAIQQESHRRKLDLKDFAVLYRTNAQSRALEEAFRKNAIPYEIIGGTRFYERKEIKDVLAYLRLLANPTDEVSLLRIINYPARGIGDVTIEHLQRFASEHSLTLFDTLKRLDEVRDLTDRAKNSLSEFSAIIDKYHSLRPQMTFSEWSRSLVDELGILSIFKEERTAESMGRWENVQELLSAISEFSNDKPDGTLESFLEEVALVSDIDTWEGEHNAVTLMTLHASKGLEFPVVMIAGLEEGLLPFYSSTIESSDVEEERRLFYVGITRAEQKLYITHTNLRYRFGDVTYPSESRFLHELGTENIERVGMKAQRQRAAASLLEFDKPASATRQLAHQKKKQEAALFSDVMPDYESESQEHFEVKRGAIVKHEIFGCGRVMVVSGKGDAQKAVVQFDSCGTKNLILKYANLKPA